MKTSLSAAFSTKALQEQEYIVATVVDKFIDRIRDIGLQGMNMTKWYEMVAFDILGEMGFGNSFHCIESGRSPSAHTFHETLLTGPSGEPHFWAELIVGHLFFITVADNLRRLWVGKALGKLLAPFTSTIRNKHTGYTRDQVAR